MSRELKVLLVILVVVVGGMVAIFALTGSNKPAPITANDTTKLTRPSSHKIDSGKVAVVEFGDYQCPACGAAYPVTKQLLTEEKGKITFSFRNFPLSMHANAQVGAYAAEAAAKQNKFWEMHDKLYETQNEWSSLSNDAAVAKFNGYAGQLGLNVEQFKTDEASQAIKDIVEADRSDGTALNIQGTPTFYVNGQQSADYTHDTLKGMIDDAAKQ